jgi:DNA repair protein radc
MGIKLMDLPESERPRDRLMRLGPEALSTAELLAIILNAGVDGESAIDVAYRLLAHREGLAGLARASFSELVAERGVGVAKAAQLQAALELGRRLYQTEVRDGQSVFSPTEAAEIILGRIGQEEQECFCVLCLNTRGKVIPGGINVLYKGTATEIQVRPAEVFREAIRRNAVSIIVGHNHPSGDPTPSTEDIMLTQRLVEAGNLIGAKVLDHIVVAGQQWVSIRDHMARWGLKWE